MMTSMTGYGRGEAVSGGITVSVEIRSVNGRFLDVVPRLPRTLSLREGDIREMIRKKIQRGKVNLNITIERENGSNGALGVNTSAAKAYYRLLNELRRTVRLKQTVKLEHLLQFSEIFEPQGAEDSSEAEWDATCRALDAAIDDLIAMRRREGEHLQEDLRERLRILAEHVERIQTLSRAQVPRERTRLRERISQILEKEPVDEGRLELEIALLADKLDVTEECTRFHGHVKFFAAAMASGEAAGRRLNFLVQEMNREVNTMGSKSSDSEIAHRIVEAKEELEKIREQLQNIE